jgi:hypothetical protein
MNRAHDCAEYYHSELNTNGHLIFYRNRVRYAPGSQFVSLHASGKASTFLRSDINGHSLNSWHILDFYVLLSIIIPVVLAGTSRVAAAAAHRRSSLPLLAKARSIGSSLVLATISILLLSFLPNSPPIVSFSRGAARLPCEARHRARLLRAALHCARAAQRAWRLAVQRARSLCCPVRPCAARNHAARGTHRAAQGTRARGVPAP